MADQSLSDLDRRTIGNLSIPRNVENLTHELRVDPHSETRSEQDVLDHLKDLEADGYVVNLGTEEDPAKIPGVAEKNKRALTIPDDSGRILATRLAHPRHQWRTVGDLWIVSNDGVNKMREPTVEVAPMTPTQVQQAVDNEWARTLKGVTLKNYNEEKHGQALTTGILEDEFQHWYKIVADDCEARWNVRPRAPMAGGAGWTDVWENFILDHENQKTSLATNDAITTPWFMALSIFAYTDADTGATHGDGTRIPTYIGYAAASVPAASLAAAAAGSSANTVAITFAACTAGSSAIIGFGNNSVVGNTSGIFRKYGACSSTTVSTTQTPATFAIGAYVTTAD
jgi:hypothetical protein